MRLRVKLHAHTHTIWALFMVKGIFSLAAGAMARWGEFLNRVVDLILVSPTQRTLVLLYGQRHLSIVKANNQQDFA